MHEEDDKKTPTAWIEVVINQLDMKEMITDDVLEEMSTKIKQVKQLAAHQTLVYQTLKEEVQSIDFKELFKDGKLLKKVHKILTRD